ncbi:MAG: 30S ribosomal protein S8 [Clostridiales bacterium]|nr:30S ribosomal protein S8 [Clostridiales bacterium]MDE6617817.1 30S ribosomal protein S8 [Clostridiales bacterium]MDE7106886.1 30S ribosomal protein S8 [Clostridiales bacterium]
MVTTDPIADLLTRIRNAITARHDTVSIPASKMKKAIVDILVDEGFVAAGEVVEEKGHNNIKVVLKYKDNRNAITNLKRISKPGLRVYCGCEDLPKVLGGYGIAIISTSRGVMTDKKARELKVGGEVLAYVW